MRYDVEVGGRIRQVNVRRSGGTFAVTLDGREYVVDAARVDAQTLSLLMTEDVRLKAGTTETGVVSGFSRTISREVTIAPDPASGQFAVHVEAAPTLVSVNGRRRWGRGEDATQAGGPQRIVAPMPGKIVRVLVKAGEAVKARQPLVVIEAMKMENELRATGEGEVAELHAQEGQSVDAGMLLAVVAPA